MAVMASAIQNAPGKPAAARDLIVALLKQTSPQHLRLYSKLVSLAPRLQRMCLSASLLAFRDYGCQWFVVMSASGLCVDMAVSGLWMVLGNITVSAFYASTRYFCLNKTPTLC